MSRSALCTLLLLAAAVPGRAAVTTTSDPGPPAVAAAAAPAPVAPPAPAAAGPRTILLGFDGMDHALTRTFMDQGLLPNLSKLAAAGTFQRLETSNPAQSPVSWAVVNTGTNPGKTGVAGFVSRIFARKDGKREGIPLPQPMLGYPTTIPAAEYLPVPMAAEQPELFQGLATLLPAVVVFSLLSLIMKLPKLLGVVLGLVGAAGGWYWGMQQIALAPADGKLPYQINPMQGTNWWTYLDAAGVRTTGVQVASTYPPDDEGPNTRLLSGLGVPDVTGSPGSWIVYTTETWAYPHPTATAGKIERMSFDLADETRARLDLPGPDNWLVKADYEHKLAALDSQTGHRDNTQADGTALADERRRLQAEFNRWKSTDLETKVSFTVDVDHAAGTLAFDVAGQKFTLREGEWSDFIPVEFVFNEAFSAHGLANFHVLKLSPEDVRIFVPPINIDPEQPERWLPISAPPDYSKELAEGIGHPYETLGWACLTNPLKDYVDSGFTVQSFMDDIVSTMKLREDLLAYNLAHPESWEVYYQVFSETDRVGHMLFRESDPAHPKYDAAYASRTVEAFGKSFPYSQALPVIYSQVDRIVGSVMDAIASGSLGDDCLLMVVADHGFTSYRRSVNLNNLMADLGFLVFKDGKTLKDVLADGNTDMLSYVDWSRTRAYSYGLGEVFINLQGREPKGIVPPDQYDALVAEICAALLDVTDGPGGPRVVTSATPRGVLFHGPWVVEGHAQRKVRGELEDVEHDGFGDIFLGYEPYYRVSWANTLGGLDKASVVDNENHWSGDHVSVDPEHVPGVFFCNRKLAEPTRAHLLDIGPTIVARYGLSADDKGFDGRVLPIGGR